MSDGPLDRSGDADFGELSSLLANAALWTEPSAALEDEVVAGIIAQRQPSVGDSATSDQIHEQDPDQIHEQDSDQPVDLSSRRARRTGGRRFRPAMAAAAILIIAASTAAGFFVGRSADLTEVALAPTEYAPGASAIARIDERPNGARLLVDLSGLEPAPLGFFYEVWLVKPDPNTPISAGTFHMRGSSDGEIEFWAGVSPQIYRTITVTLESEADPDAPGELVLKGQLEI